MRKKAACENRAATEVVKGLKQALGEEPSERRLSPQTSPSESRGWEQRSGIDETWRCGLGWVVASSR